MKTIVILFLLAFLAIGAFAHEKYQDVVYLKNGSIIRGMIIEQVPNKSLKMVTADRSIFVFQLEEIEKYTREPLEGRTVPRNDSTGLKTGYRGIVEAGFQTGVGVWGTDRIKVNVINGFQLSPYFSLGLGTGLRFYYDSDAALIPVFADFRAHLLNHKVSPYFSLGAGYSFNASNDMEGVGFLLNPAAGVSFKVSDKSFMNVGVGYELQSMEYVFYNTSNPYTPAYITRRNNNSICLTVGFSF